MDEPLDASEAPMLLLLMEHISGDGIRLILSGSGPDEIHDGYGLGGDLTDSSPESVPASYYDKFSWNFSVDMNRLLPDAAASTRDRVLSKYRDMLAFYAGQITHPAQASQLINFHGRLNAYEFAEMDRTSMRHGIEVRSPLIDRRLIKQAFAYDPALKDHQGQSKWLYKQGWRGIVPDHIIDRPKVGFPTPIEFWFSTIFRDRIRQTLDKSSLFANSGVINHKYFDEISELDDPNFRALDYRFYCLEKTLQHHKSVIQEAKSDKRSTLQAVDLKATLEK
jgi:asparagine synthase (glutamine-hydrolysing)